MSLSMKASAIISVLCLLLAIPAAQAYGYGGYSAYGSYGSYGGYGAYSGAHETPARHAIRVAKANGGFGFRASHAVHVHVQHHEIEGVYGGYGAYGGYGGYGRYGGYGVHHGIQLNCNGECVDTYAKCAGKGIHAQRPCCNEDDQCVFKNPFYSQCRPKSKGIPSWWANGRVLPQCGNLVESNRPEISATAEPALAAGGCDESAVTFKYDTAQLMFTASDEAMKAINDLDEPQCKEACLSERGCVMYEHRPAFTMDDDSEIPLASECFLYDEKTLPANAQIIPRHSGVNGEPAYTVAGVKCFHPPQVCGTVERQSNVAVYHMSADDVIRSTQIQVSGEASDIVVECSNLCALGFRSNQLEAGSKGVCGGFAVDGDLCTLLYPQTEFTVPYVPDLDSKVYSISGC